MPLFEMSEYYRTLPPVANDRYLDEFISDGLEEGDKPYANDGRLYLDIYSVVCSKLTRLISTSLL